MLTVADNKAAKKKLYVKTYGCQMNVYDSLRMEDLFKSQYELAQDFNSADLVILNTCHIREKAAEKVYSELGRINQEKQRLKNEYNRHMVIAVAGCVAQAEGDQIIKRAPFVDVVVGPQSYHNLPDLVKRINNQEAVERICLDFTEEKKFDYLPEERSSNSAAAFLSIQEGCDKFCSFCVVPYTRGAEFSRPQNDIITEAKRLVDSGVKEITLLGQNVNGYHGLNEQGQISNLGKLIFALEKISGLERIRYTTSHPRDMHDELYEAHALSQKLMPFLHLPVQSGSNNILQAMNRKHDRDTYFAIIEKLRIARPDIALSSDFIVGFPGETDQDFADTLDLVKQVGFAQCYSFKYSPRPGTPAALKEEQVAEDIKSARLQKLQNLLTSQQHEFNNSLEGKTIPVLFDRMSDKQLLGRSPYLQTVCVVKNKEQFNQILPVHITRGGPHSLTGEVVNC